MPLQLNEVQQIASIGLLVMAFSRTIKNEVRRVQEGFCAHCGEKPKKLEIHHRIPSAHGGPDTIDNAVGLCGDDLNGCHGEYDKLAFEENIYYEREL